MVLVVQMPCRKLLKSELKANKKVTETVQTGPKTLHLLLIYIYVLKSLNDITT